MSRLETIAERRRSLIAQCDADRAALATAFRGVERELHIADRVVAMARGLNRHRVLVGVAAAGLILAPVMARKWIRNAVWWLPIAIEGYRVVKNLRAARDA